MIPKKIHYCWFGGNEKPELVIKCINSWKEKCPDYQIIEWNESSFDVECNDFVKEAYKSKKWAFVSDVARLYALVQDGGIYMDTDVEVLQSLDPFLKYRSVIGFESTDYLSTAFLATENNNVLFKEMLEQYNNLNFYNNDGSISYVTNVQRMTELCVKCGLKLDGTFQELDNITIFPPDYFSPKNYKTGELNMSKNTVCIHHFDGSWIPADLQYEQMIKMKLKKLISEKPAGYIAKYISVLKYYGFKKSMNETISWLKRK